jgi:hypothetical protein
MNENYKLIDTITGERLDEKVYFLTLKEAQILNIAYATNGVSKKYVELE